MDIQKKDNLTDVVQALLELETKPVQVKPEGTILNSDGEIVLLGQDEAETK